MVLVQNLKPYPHKFQKSKTNNKYLFHINFFQVTKHSKIYLRQIHESKMRRYLILLYKIVIISSFLFCQDLEALLDQANSKMKIGELKSADDLLQESLKNDPSFAPAHRVLSELWLRKGDLFKANEYATMAVRIDEDFRPWWNGLNNIRSKIQNGKRNVQQGKYEKAMQEYEAIAEKYPYFPEAQFYMGLTKFRQKDIEAAAFYFSEALKIYPDHQKARKGLNNVTKQLRK